MTGRSDIFVGVTFVFVGLIYALFDRWQMELTIQGVVTRKPHKFDHFFVMWTLRQLLQLGLFFLSKTNARNWFGFVRFNHGELESRGNVGTRDTGQPSAENVNTSANDVEQIQVINVNTSANDVEQIQVINVNTSLLEIVQSPAEHIEPEGAKGSQNLIVALDERDNEERDEEERDEGERAPNSALEETPQEGQVQRTREPKKPSKIMYFPPAFFAMTHVLLLYFGLKLTYSSSFIMLKGTVTFFTALLSLAFLSQQLACCIWFGVVVATLGFVVSGISDYIFIPNDGYEKYGIAAGDLLILMSQIMFATKIIYEEKFIQKHSIHPMLFLGCEGIYGTFFAVTFLLVFNFVDAVQYSNLPNGRLEDIHDFILQFANSWKVMIAVVGSLVSYILYTYLGLSLIRNLGALPRIMIETFVWSFYWAVCLALKWEHFFLIQVPGLCIITIGVLFFQFQPCSSYFKRNVNSEQDNLCYTYEAPDQNGPVENQMPENIENDDTPIPLFTDVRRCEADLRGRGHENEIRDDDQQIHEQNGSEFENQLQENIDDDNVPLIPDTRQHEADLLRHRGRESLYSV